MSESPDDEKLRPRPVVHRSKKRSGHQKGSDADDLTVDPSDLTADASELTAGASELTANVDDLTADASDMTVDANDRTINPNTAKIGAQTAKTEPNDGQSSGDDLTLQATAEHSSQRPKSSLSASQSRRASASNRALFEDPQALGAFSLVKKLGSGTFGDVFRAKDTQLDRDVAIKVVRAEKAGDEAQRESFLEEARSVAQLKHKNIVPVHQVGELQNGSPFIVYEFIDGPTLRQRKKLQKRFLPHEAVELLSKIADGLGHAHDLGIFHRDVKPANILIEEKTGEPHVADFGCASRRDYRKSSDSDSGRSYVGTLAYFSPEQAAGKSKQADARTDVWALGIIMDELLSGKRSLHELETMYGGSQATLKDYLDNIQSYRPPPLRERVSIDRDLNAIWKKCLAIDPDERYQDANLLADDLRRWQRSEPVRARPISLGARLVRWAKRNPQIAASLTTVFGTILAAAIVTFILFQWGRSANKQRVDTVVEQLFGDPSELRHTIRQLREQELRDFRSFTTEALNNKWSELTTKHDSSDQLSFRAWRLSMGFVALDPAKGNGIPIGDLKKPIGENPYVDFAELLVSQESPKEFQAAQEILDGLSPKNVAWLKNNLLPQKIVPLKESVNSSERLEAAERNLKAACLLSSMGNKDVSGSTVADWLYFIEAESREKSKGKKWTPVALAAFDGLRTELVKLRELPDKSRSVINDLLVVASETPTDLIQQIGGAGRSLAGILPTLKLRINAQIENGEISNKLSFQDFVTVAKPSPSPMLTAELWLAYLYCADLDRDIAEIDRHLLRTSSSETNETASDRTAETVFVCEAYSSGLSREVLLDLCRRWHEKRDNRLRPVLLALGNFGAPPDVSGQALESLLSIWKDNPDAGAHSACEWLMKKWSFLRPEHYRQLPSQYSRSRGWRYDDGMLFVRIEKPNAPLQMGIDRSGLEELTASVGFADIGLEDAQRFQAAHRRQILSGFEVSAYEISSGEYLAYLKDDQFSKLVGNSQSRKSRAKRFEYEQYKEENSNDPVADRNWYEAIEFCTWRSWKQERESCYGEVKMVSQAFEKVENELQSGKVPDIVLPACDRSKNGYRLPTSAEWEMACRAGTKTLWPFGSDRYLRDYANTAENGGKLRTCGTLRPNAAGLFDTLGNVEEWTDSFRRSYPSFDESDILYEDKVIRPRLRRDTENKQLVDNIILRGGNYKDDYAFNARSSFHRGKRASERKPEFGFRIVRSLGEDASDDKN